MTSNPKPPTAPQRRPLRISARIDPSGPPIPVLCRFYTAGYCANGDACRFIHPQPQAEGGAAPLGGAAGGSQSEGEAEAGAPGAPRGFVRPELKDFVESKRPRSEKGLEEAAAIERLCGETADEEEGLGGESGGIDFRAVYESLCGVLEGNEDDDERFRGWPGRCDGRSYAGAVGGATDFGMSSGNLLDSRRAHWTNAVGRSGTDLEGMVPTIPIEDSMVLCKYNVEGNCRYGDGCRYAHGFKCEICGKNAIHPTNRDEAERHRAVCEMETRRRERIRASGTVDCGICMESPATHGKKFGLLRECEHAFCLPCIRQWRGSVGTFGREAVRSCPVCRCESFLVIPSDVYIKDPDKKAELEDRYKASLAAIPCKHFDFGNGACPFGGSCFYAHTDREGNPIAPPDRPPLLVSSSGEVRLKKAPSLADYITS